MGRAIDMEKDIDALKTRVSKLESILDDILEGVSTTKHIDLVDEVKEEDFEEEKTNDERDAKSSKQSNNRKSSNKKKNS